MGRSNVRSGSRTTTGGTQPEASLSRCWIFALEDAECAVGRLSKLPWNVRLARETVRATMARSMTTPRRLKKRRSVTLFGLKSRT